MLAHYLDGKKVETRKKQKKGCWADPDIYAIYAWHDEENPQ